MYVGNFSAVSNQQDWTQIFEVVDDDTDEDIDLTGALIVFEIRDPRTLATLVSATTTNGKITITDTGVFQVSFLRTDMQTLWAATFEVGCTININDQTLQYIVGTLPVLDGIVSQ